MDIQEVVKIPYEFYEGAFHTGSSFICEPPVTNTDIDFMILTEDASVLDRFLRENKFSRSQGSDLGVHNKPFRAYRKDSFNFIVTWDSDYYNKFKEATMLAKVLNLREKPQRIALFQYIVDGGLAWQENN